MRILNQEVLLHYMIQVTFQYAYHLLKLWDYKTNQYQIHNIIIKLYKEDKELY